MVGCRISSSFAPALKVYFAAARSFNNTTIYSSTKVALLVKNIVQCGFLLSHIS